MILISKLYEKVKENNLTSGIIIFILITFILIVVNPYWYGIYMFRDLEFLAGAFIGVLFALKNRKSGQSSLKFGIIVGVVGGVLTAVVSGFYLVLFFRIKGLLSDPIYWLFPYIGLSIITGLVLGLIIGGLIGWYYMTKDAREKEDDTVSDDFFQDLIEK